MTGAGVALLAGTVSTVLFASSTLPMVLKAFRTKDLASYSLANLVLANVGNAVHCIYVVHLPAGPIWALHGFYVVTSGLMLLWCLRYRRGVRTSGTLLTERRLGWPPNVSRPSSSEPARPDYRPATTYAVEAARS